MNVKRKLAFHLVLFTGASLPLKFRLFNLVVFKSLFSGPGAATNPVNNQLGFEINASIADCKQNRKRHEM